MQEFGKVGVLAGGVSAEREVSLSSGREVFKALKEKGVNAHLLDIGEDPIKQLRAAHFDRVFSVLHGHVGEDGRTQALLEFLKIPYCGSGVAGSAFAMDKIRCKWIWQANALATPDFLVVNSEEGLKTVEQRFQFPLCIKPAAEGSSVGITKVKSAAELLPAYREANPYTGHVMAEQWIEGGEYTVAIVDGETFPSVKISTPNREFYDYEAKYIDHSTVYDCPSDLTAEQEKEIQQIALQAFNLIGCKAWGRVDFIQDKQGKFWLIEVNTIPGMTPTSLLPKAAKQKGLSFADVVLKILRTTL